MLNTVGHLLYKFKKFNKIVDFNSLITENIFYSVSLHNLND